MEQALTLTVNSNSMTNSGKTTLARRIKADFPSTVIINQDKHFRVIKCHRLLLLCPQYLTILFLQTEDDPNHIWVDLDETRRHQNWEALECIRWDEMCAEILQTVNQSNPNNAGECRYLVIDGHIIYNYRPIYEVCDKRYFIQFENKSAIAERREQRDYIPPDPAGYFDQWVYPLYFENKNKLIEEQLEIS